MSSKRVFRTRISGRANELFGAVDYTLTDTITEIVKGGVAGLEVETRALGTSEGERVDERKIAFWPGVSMDKAAAYRLSHGYSEVK